MGLARSPPARPARALELYDAHQSTLNATQKANALTAADRQDDIIKFMADAIGRPYPFESHGTVLYNADLGYALESQTKSHFSVDVDQPRHARARDRAPVVR